jgi:acyl dehydratase
MRIGDRFTKDVAFTEDSIRQFATYVGDSNPLHHDQVAAAASPFGRLIASGTQTFSMMLAALPDYLRRGSRMSGWKHPCGCCGRCTPGTALASNGRSPISPTRPSRKAGLSP